MLPKILPSGRILAWTHRVLCVLPLAWSLIMVRFQSGGSTITQQVVKNLSQDTADTGTRKIQEAFTAVGMTQQYSKAKILEMYFNIAPFDNADYGIEAAVEAYFHLQDTCDTHGKCIPGVARLNYNTATQKDDPLLGLARASLLACMPQIPHSTILPRVMIISRMLWGGKSMC